MIQCPVCGRYFKNKQALRAHRRFCKRRIQKQGDETYFKALALDLIMYVRKTKKSKFDTSELAKKLGISSKTAEEFSDWLKKSKYYELLRFVLKCAQKQS